jgi:hypothetical protein
MIYWMLTVVLAVACVLAATLTDFRKVVLSVWCAQLSFGGLALQMGSSYLALLVWILGTLCAVVLLAYGSVFGDLFCKEPATQLSEGHQEGATPRTWPAILLPLGGLTAALFFCPFCRERGGCGGEVEWSRWQSWDSWRPISVWHCHVLGAEH